MAIRVPAVAEEVSAGSGEQTRGLRRIGGAVVRLQHRTQSAAQAAEQTATAGEDQVHLWIVPMAR
jgi:methyl-accepting chemotaxis protein